MQSRKRMDGQGRAHVLVLPYPVTGHTNPMLHFSKTLASKGLRLTFVNFRFDHQRMLQALTSIQCLRSGLEQLIRRLNGSGPQVSCIMYDSFLPWVGDVANKLKIPLALFSTQSAAVTSIYYHYKHVETWNPESKPDTITIPGLPEMKSADLPTTFLPWNVPWNVLKFLLDELDHIAEASWVFVNSFYELERETFDYMRTRTPLIPVGPLIPSAFLDGGNPNDRQVGGNPWEEAECMQWLDAKPPSSVVYISFGSLTFLSPEQIHEMALGLQRSEQKFVWVIRAPPGHDGLTDIFPMGFMEETRERGLVVPWCAQLEVLSHPSVGVFMSHCGWNSTVDALSLGIPMLTFGVWTDQTTNSKFVADVWKTGLRMRRREDGIVGREEIERCVRLAIQSEEFAEIRKNCLKWKEIAQKTMMEGGCSDTNVNGFVQEIVEKAELLSALS
eukprot:Gb_33856 [translate_table: standard]